MKRVVVLTNSISRFFVRLRFRYVFFTENGNSEEKGSYAKFVVGLWSVTLAWSFFSGPGCAPGPGCASSTFCGCNRVGPGRSRETAGWGHSCTPWPGVPHRPGHCRCVFGICSQCPRRDKCAIACFSRFLRHRQTCINLSGGH